MLVQMNYGRMRLQWCRSVVFALLRRWAVYIVMGLGLLGAFSVGAMTSIPAMTALTVLPLFRAAQWPTGWALACAAGHAMVGALVIIAVRPLLWPAAWRDAEQALPIPPRERMKSDLGVVTLSLTPLFALYAAGALTWRYQSPAWMQGLHAKAWLLLGLSACLSLTMGLVIVARARKVKGHVRTRGGPVDKAGVQAPRSLRSMPWWQALVLRPLRTKPASRITVWLSLHTASLGATATLIAVHKASWAPWYLAGMGLLSLAGTARAGRLIEAELLPLHQACVHLPIPPSRLGLARQALQGLAAACGWVTLLLAWPVSQARVRPVLALSYMIASILAHIWLIRVESRDDNSQVSRWMLALVVLTALASEVFA